MVFMIDDIILFGGSKRFSFLNDFIPFTSISIMMDWLAGRTSAPVHDGIVLKTMNEWTIQIVFISSL